MYVYSGLPENNSLVLRNYNQVIDSKNYIYTQNKMG